MSTSTIARAIQNATRRSTVSMTPKRSFHSPFAMLSANSSPTTHNASHAYEKATDVSSTEPTFSYSGRKTYVVSQPDPQSTHYKVPAGAYPTSEPYVNYEATSTPEPYAMSSTSSGPAHLQTNNLDGLKERGVPPIGKVASKYSRMGNAEAWKARA